jgi:hypothetical protein
MKSLVMAGMIVIAVALPAATCNNNPTWGDADSRVEFQAGDAMGIGSVFMNLQKDADGGK